MKTIKLSAFFGNNVGDDLMVEILLKKYPRYRFYYDHDDACSSLFLRHKNLENRRSIYRKCYIWDKLISKITFGKKTNALFSRMVSRRNRQCCCGVLIGGSMYMQLTPKQKIHQQLKWAEDTFGNIPHTIIGVNFGPYQDEEFRLAFTDYFRKCQSVTFRDKTSYGMFSQLPNTYFAPDVVFNLQTDQYVRKSTDGTVLISVINMPYRTAVSQWTEVYDQYIAECCSAAVLRGKTPVLVSFCKQEEDEVAIERILGMLPKEVRDTTKTVFYRGDLDEILRLFAGADYIVATRFHAMILALCFDKPFFSISYSDKVRWVLEDIGCESWRSLEQLSEMRVGQMFDWYTQPMDVTDYKLQAHRQFEQFERYMNYGKRT